MPGAVGSAGPPGQKGEAGTDGTPGQKGEKGWIGMDGDFGPAGTQGDRVCKIETDVWLQPDSYFRSMYLMSWHQFHSDIVYTEQHELQTSLRTSPSINFADPPS